MKNLSKHLDTIVSALGKLAAWSIAFLLTAIVIQVIARYVFHSSSVALQDLQWRLFATSLLLGVSYTILMKGHAKVDVFHQRFPAKTQKWIDILGLGLCAMPLYAFLLWHGWSLAYKSYAIGEASVNQGGLAHVWLAKGLIPLCCFLVLLASAARILQELTEEKRS